MARNKPRKWSNLKGVLPEAPDSVELSERMVEIFREKDARQALDMQGLAAELNDLEEEEAFSELAARERGIKVEAINRRILEELEKVKAISGQDMWRGLDRTASPQNLILPVIQDKAALRAWIEEKSMQSLLELPSGRLRHIIGLAFDTDQAVTMTPAQRAALKPGDPASGSPPPGVTVYIRTKVHHTSKRKKGATTDKDEE